MRKNLMKIFLVGFITIMMTACGGDSTNDLQSKIEKLEAANSELEVANSELEATNAELEAANADSETTNSDSEATYPERLYKYSEETYDNYNYRLAAPNRELLIYDDDTDDTFSFPTKDGIFDLRFGRLSLVTYSSDKLDTHIYDVYTDFKKFLAYDEISQHLLLRDYCTNSLSVFDLNTESIEFIISYPLCTQLNPNNPSIINYVDLDRVEYSVNWTEDSFSFSPTGRTDVFQYHTSTGAVELMDGYYTWDVESQNVYDSTGNVVLSNIVDYDYDYCTDFEWYYLLDSTGTLYRFSPKDPACQVVGENIIAIYEPSPEGLPTFIIDENSVYDTWFSVYPDFSRGNATFIN